SDEPDEQIIDEFLAVTAGLRVMPILDASTAQPNDQLRLLDAIVERLSRTDSVPANASPVGTAALTSSCTRAPLATRLSTCTVVNAGVHSPPKRSTMAARTTDASRMSVR